jgi:hypothetical protein
MDVGGFGIHQVRVKQAEVSTKRASVEHRINKYIIILVVMQILTCLGGQCTCGVCDRTDRIPPDVSQGPLDTSYSRTTLEESIGIWKAATPTFKVRLFVRPVKRQLANG